VSTLVRSCDATLGRVRERLAVAALPRVGPAFYDASPAHRSRPQPSPTALRRLDAEGARAVVEDSPKLSRGLSLSGRANRRRCSAGSSTNPSPEVPPWLSSRLRTPPSLSASPDWLGVGLQRREGAVTISSWWGSTICRASILPSDLRSSGPAPRLPPEGQPLSPTAGPAPTPSGSLSRSPSRRY
jgi:hypothetical protein